MEEGKGYGHLRLPNTRFESHKKTPRRYFGPTYPFSQEDMEVFSERLTEGLNNSIKTNKSFEVQASSYIFKLQSREELTAADKQKIEKLGLHWLNPTSLFSVIVSLPEEKREKILKKIREYGKTGKFKSYLNPFAKIEPIKPEKRISKEIDQTDEEAIWADVEFYSGLSLEDYTNAIDYIKKSVNPTKILKSKVDDPEIPFFRIKASRPQIHKIANNVASVRRIQKVPEIKTVTDQTLRGIQNVSFQPAADDLERIMVIDCGINHEHPGIKNVLITKKSYIPSDTLDMDGHGTKVAGLAAYGSFPTSGILRATSKIGAAKIHEGEDGTEMESVLEEIVRDGISKSIRIYSLTVLYDRPVNEEISKVAYEIDKLSRDYDILFIISSGNIGEDQLRVFRSLGLSYPQYFQDSDSKILFGAESACGMTIGGIANGENAGSIAKRRQASPFTRAGPTPDGRLKPELVHFAGNLSYSFECQDDLGVMSLSNKPNEQLFSYDHGTSFSAPIVANGASQILKNYPTATANLIRALLAHHSKVDEDMRNVDEPQFVYGFGFPNIDRAIRSTPFSPTMIFEGEIETDKIAKIRIPVPKEIGLSKGSKLMRITLTYDPPVSLRNQAISYTAIDLRFDVFRKNKKGEYLKVSGTDKSWQTPFYRADKNTVKKDTFQWERGHVGEDWMIRLTPSIRDYKFKGKKQKFALVVTIEGLNKAIDLYGPIKRILEEEMAVKQAIKVPVLRPQSLKSKIKKSSRK